jgi:hypothetical protein
VESLQGGDPARLRSLQCNTKFNTSIIVRYNTTDPTFIFFKGGVRVESLQGGDPARLRSLVDELSYVPPPPEAKSPYAHFPLKESEQVCLI